MRWLFITLLPWYPSHSHSRGDVPLVGRACAYQWIKLDIQALASKDTRLQEGRTKHQHTAYHQEAGPTSSVLEEVTRSR